MNIQSNFEMAVVACKLPKFTPKWTPTFVFDEHISARVRINPVRIWCIHSRSHRHMVNVHVLTVHWVKTPKGRIPESDTSHLNVCTINKLNKIGADDDTCL